MKSWKKPTPEQVDKAVALLVYLEHYRYFFDRLENPEWLEPLKAKGFFKQPPEPERNEEEGTLRCPPWPEGRYLARMAPHKAELVAQIIQEMDNTDNAAVLADMVDALLAMPVEISVGLAERVRSWAARPYGLLPEKLGELMAQWAKGGYIQEALQVASVLLDVLPDEHQAEPGHPEAYPLPEPRARFHIWPYEQILKTHYVDLVREAGRPALDLLCHLLEKAIRLSQPPGVEYGPENYVGVWRLALGDNPENLRRAIPDVLLFGARDVAKLFVGSGQVSLEEVVAALETRRWKVFRRLALHLLRVFPDRGEAMAAKRLTDRSLFEDHVLRHDYVLLLREFFPRLTPGEQDQILGWIENGPELEGWKQWRESVTGRQPTEEEVARHREKWQRDWLEAIGPEKLPAQWQERFRELVGKHGKAKHLGSFDSGKAQWLSAATPKKAEELKVMSLSEIVDFLQSWQPPCDDFCAPSREDLGLALATVVAQQPERFAVEAFRFQGLDPTYVRALLSGLREALKQGKSFPWEPVLRLCAWVLSQPREIPERRMEEDDPDPDWGWTRQESAELLAAGFNAGPASIPFELRQTVWAILKPLTQDPEPTPEYEERYGGSNMDPATLSINTTRGAAMHAVMRYALWVRQHLENEPNAQQRLQKGFREMPEVREVLEAHLDPAREPSLAIRAVYGQWFPSFVLIDPEWARIHAPGIFPSDQESGAFFAAAWNKYVIFSEPYGGVLEILRPQYEYAVKEIGIRRDNTRWLADPDEKLAEHLMTFYARGKLSLQDTLLTVFWAQAPQAIRAHALGFLGRVLTQTDEEIPAEVLHRLKQLWEKRFDEVKDKIIECEKEMAAFGWWYASGKFDVDWALTMLAKVLERFKRVEPIVRVLARLEIDVETHPQEAVQCLRMVAEADRKGWEIYLGGSQIRKILQVSLRDPLAAEVSEKTIHYLGSRGFQEFRDLLVPGS
jgi:hypothetical protein